MTKKINQEFLAQRTLGQGTDTNFWEGSKIIMVKYGFTILNLVLGYSKHLFSIMKI